MKNILPILFVLLFVWAEQSPSNNPTTQYQNYHLRYIYLNEEDNVCASEGQHWLDQLELVINSDRRQVSDIILGQTYC